MAHETILIVDDEKNIVELVRYNLQKEGYRVVSASDGQAGVDAAVRERPALILLDLLLPTLDGLEVCRRLKRQPATAAIPVIMLTAKATETDKVTGLELGADDYLTKPFSIRELLARIRAVLRRQEPVEGEPVFRCGTLEADWARHQVSVRGKVLHLTPKEFELLKVLAAAQGRVLSREMLLEKIWSYDHAVEIETRTVDFHVSQLRKKLAGESWRLVTVPASGYKLVLDAKAPSK